jgi:septal ring factor EnvC (AmiA/AmiB activator)
VAGESNKIRIGIAGTQNATFIAGISGVAVTGSQVVVNSNGKLGVAASSARFKQAIKPMDKTSEAILALEPVTFRYKEEIDPDASPQFGLVAEQVEKVNPDLVARDEKGKVYTVRYEAVNAMLLNEFLKQHRKVEEQEAAMAQQQKQFQSKIAQQEREIKTLTATLKEQASAIQKVSDRLELSNPSPQIAANDQ